MNLVQGMLRAVHEDFSKIVLILFYYVLNLLIFMNWMFFAIIWNKTSKVINEMKLSKAELSHRQRAIRLAMNLET